MEGTSGREAKSSLVAQMQCTPTEVALNYLPLSQAICMLLALPTCLKIKFQAL